MSETILEPARIEPPQHRLPASDDPFSPDERLGPMAESGARFGGTHGFRRRFAAD